MLVTKKILNTINADRCCFAATVGAFIFVFV